MLWELVFGFVVLVAASYVGTTMALRGFFGRERFVSDLEARADEGSDSGEVDATDESNETGNANGTDESHGTED